MSTRHETNPTISSDQEFVELLPLIEQSLDVALHEVPASSMRCEAFEDLKAEVLSDCWRSRHNLPRARGRHTYVKTMVRHRLSDYQRQRKPYVCLVLAEGVDIRDVVPRGPVVRESVRGERCEESPAWGCRVGHEEMRRLDQDPRILRLFPHFTGEEQAVPHVDEDGTELPNMIDTATVDPWGALYSRLDYEDACAQSKRCEPNGAATWEARVEQDADWNEVSNRVGISRRSAFRGLERFRQTMAHLLAEYQTEKERRCG